MFSSIFNNLALVLTFVGATAMADPMGTTLEARDVSCTDAFCGNGLDCPGGVPCIPIVNLPPSLPIGVPTQAITGICLPTACIIP
ncbi:hypothetical protein ONZ51_g1675 [Trametes cubensis]|uniref:Uncharacterized protein n=1 Tax=Trametes cubensis TaxID=1111947 RepID=A0AAD7U139_9APHY|nr:hypothetical protein ONZ51_g1675 [Trametes cubensis]